MESHARPLFRARWPTAVRAIAIAFGVVMVLQALFVGVATASTLGSPTPPASPATPVNSLSSTVTTSPGMVTSLSGGGSPGSSPAGETRVSAPSWSTDLLPPNVKPAGTPYVYPGSHPANTVLTPGASSPVPRPGPAGVDYGYVTGIVEDSRLPNVPLSGVQVSANPLTGFCPSVGCVPVQTNANGGFTVTATVGENEIEFADSYYMTNRTWTYVTADGVINIGTVYLLHDGFVSGILLADDPSHRPVSAINITAITRDGSFEAEPSAHPDPVTGRFTVAVPPVPSEIEFTPIFQYSPFVVNYTFVNVSAGDSIDIGTVYMEHLTLVSLTVDDSTTGQPIVGDPMALLICSKVTGQCAQNQGTASGGPIAYGEAPPGPDTVEVLVNAYVLNVTSLGIVPVRSFGSAPVNMGVADVVPMGAVYASYGVMGNPSTIWNTGMVYITVCSLDAIDFSAYNPVTGNLTTSDCSAACGAVPVAGDISAVPLRNVINVEPATSNQCGLYPTWPIPGDLPVFANHGWANVTPNLATNLGELDVLPGTYVEGQVLPTTQTGWNVQACSTDEPLICGPASYADSAYQYIYTNFVPSGCPTGQTANTVFCVAAPPGPFKVQVASPNASGNWTWGYDTPLSWPEQPLMLQDASANKVQSINLTTAQVTGRVLQALSYTPVQGLPGVEICPAGAAPAAVVCGAGVANTTGFFSVAAPPGWDQVRVSAPDYVANETWIYVVKSNNTGTILLTPDGYIDGQVLIAGGTGISLATVRSCPVVNPAGCTPVSSSGLTSTDGRYYGAVTAGPTPVGSYEIQASATGYATDWTWVNVTTPGQNFTVPSITLQPLRPQGSGTGLAAAASAGIAGSGVGSWIEGRVVDATLGLGIPTASVTALPNNGAAPIGLSSVRGTGGEFNDSLPIGNYVLQVSQSGYTPQLIPLNVSGNATVIDLGTIALQAYPTITGRLVIAPWQQAVSDAYGLGPGMATVSACGNQGTPCGPGSVADSAGLFNVSAPVGTYDFVSASAAGTGIGTYPGGFLTTSEFINVSNATGFNSAGNPINMDIFGTVTGSVVEMGNPTVPVRFDVVTLDSDHPVDATGTVPLSANGTFTMYFPEADILNVTAGGQGAWIQEAASFPGPVVNETQTELLLPGGFEHFAPFQLPHFGYVMGEVTNAETHQPVPYATVATSEPGTLWGTAVTWTSNGVANGQGLVNLTAPPSIPATQLLTINVSAPDYTYMVLNTTVNSSETSYLNGTGPFSLHGVGLKAWGWFAGTVVDALNGRALEGVSSTDSDALHQISKSGVTTNGLGKFFVDAPPNPKDQLSIVYPGYSKNLTYYNVTNGQILTVPTVHLSGDGILEGRVASFPTGQIVAGATVYACPKLQPNCANSATTNGSGFFAIIAPPGVDLVTVSAPGFVTNSPVYVDVSSDTWKWIGQITIDEYAYVTGIVLGVPLGAPIGGANASLCSLPIGGQLGAGPCFTTVTTQPDGTFLLQAPAGVYVLEMNASFYNNTYLPISLQPGQTLAVGTQFIDEYGTAAGLVMGADTGKPLAGALVSACQQWGARTCSPLESAGADGRYAISGPPGPYQIEATASGYQSGFAAVKLQTGSTTTVPTFSLVPIGPGFSYTVTGSVWSTGAVSAPLVGAVVVATGGFSATVGSNGNFSITLPWGNYTLAAHDAGYQSRSQVVGVFGPVSDVRFLLPLTVYTVSGRVIDGLTHEPLYNATVSEGGVSLARTAKDGSFTVELANGTHDLQIESATGAYALAGLIVVVNGANVATSVSMFPPTDAVLGLVTSALTGLPIGGASVTLTGSTSEGTSWSVPLTTDANGRFSTNLYPGNYMIAASVAGFSGGSVGVHLTANASSSETPVNLALQPIQTAPSAGASGSELWSTVAVAAIAAGAVAVALVLLRRPPSGGGTSSHKNRGGGAL